MIWGSDWRLETRRLLRAMVEDMVMPVPRQQQRVVNHCVNQLLCFTLENIIPGTSVLFCLNNRVFDSEKFINSKTLLN